MAVPELIGELLAPVGRFLVWVFVEILWELLVKRAGSLAVRPFRRDVTLDSGIVLAAGLAIWLAIAIMAYLVVTR